MSAANNGIALALSLIAWLCSYLIASLFIETDKYYYVVLMLLDSFFVAAVSWVAITNLQKRYMTVVLALAATVSGVGAINEIFYSDISYDSFGFPFISFIALTFDENYKAFSLIMSILLCVVALTPKGFLDAINVYWPRALDFVYCDYAEFNLAHSKKGSWDSRRGEKR